MTRNIRETHEFWQTKARGDNEAEYLIYLDLADDGSGREEATGLPLKSFDEWLNA